MPPFVSLSLTRRGSTVKLSGRFVGRQCSRFIQRTTTDPATRAELNAGGFQRPLHLLQIDGKPSWNSSGGSLHPLDGVAAHARMLGELVCRPPQKLSARADLITRDHGAFCPNLDANHCIQPDVGVIYPTVEAFSTGIGGGVLA